MKKIIYLLGALCLLSACGKVDDTSLVQSLDELEFRLNVVEDRCRRINTNIKALKSIVLKSPEKDRITAVLPIKEGDEVTGYRIEFAYGESVEVFCAKDGKDGVDGVDGKDGKDGMVPAIGMKTEGNTSYWTINGEYILDADGQRIPLVVKGQSSMDGRTPMLKTEGGEWFCSMDGGATWKKIDVSVRYGDGNIFSSVTQNDTEVVFTLSDGTSINIPKKSDIALTLSDASLAISAGQTTEVSYQVSGGDAQNVVDAFAQGAWKAEVTASSETAGKIRITAPADAKNSTVVVFATSGSGLSVYRTIKLTVL